MVYTGCYVIFNEKLCLNSFIWVLDSLRDFGICLREFLFKLRLAFAQTLLISGKSHSIKLYIYLPIAQVYFAVKYCSNKLADLNFIAASFSQTPSNCFICVYMLNVIFNHEIRIDLLQTRLLEILSKILRLCNMNIQINQTINVLLYAFAFAFIDI